MSSRVISFLRPHFDDAWRLACEQYSTKFVRLENFETELPYMDICYSMMTYRELISAVINRMKFVMQGHVGDLNFFADKIRSGVTDDICRARFDEFTLKLNLLQATIDHFTSLLSKYPRRPRRENEDIEQLEWLAYDYNQYLARHR